MKKIWFFLLSLCVLLALTWLWQAYSPLPLVRENTVVAFLLPEDSDPIWQEGVEQACLELGLSAETGLVYWVDAEKDASFAQALTDAKEQGAKVFFCLDSQGESAVLEEAAQFPQGEYFLLGGEMAKASPVDNVHGLEIARWDAAYVLGCLAAEKSENGVLACLLPDGEETSLACCYGFYQGAKSVNPEISLVAAVCTGESPLSFSQVTLGLMDQGATVLFSLVQSEEALAAAKAEGGSLTLAMDEEAADYTCVWNLSPMFTQIAASPRGEKLLAKEISFSYAQGVWSISPLDAQGKEALSALGEQESPWPEERPEDILWLFTE